ncbi:MAG: hypothetical protein ACHQQS_04520 [Thermoanaerobaculales bacterium]
MNIVHRRWLVSTLGLLSLLGLSACLVAGRGRDEGVGVAYVGGYYEPYGHDYGGWGSGYHVAPPRDGDRRREQSTSHVYRPAPPDRRTPKIPTRPRDHHNP